MKLYRNAIILIAVLALLIGGYLMVTKMKGSDDSIEEATTSENLALVTLDSEKINAISLNNEELQLEFSKEETEWVLKSPSAIKTDKDSISSLVGQLTGLTAERFVEENPSDLNQYGLDKPRIVITIGSNENKTQTMELGDRTPTKEAYYLLEKGTNKVYTVSVYYGDQFLDAKSQIRDRTLFTFKTNEKTGAIEDVQTISMDRGGKLLFSSKKESESTWVLTAPFQANANLESIMPIVDAFSKLMVIDFVEDEAKDLEKYGLDKPSYALEVSTSTNKNKILLGDVMKDSSNFYAVIEGSSAVFTVDPSGLTFLDKPLKEIIEPFAYIVNIGDVSKIEITMDGRTDVCLIETDKDKGEVKADRDKDKFFFNGKDATLKDNKDSQPFRQFYQALIGITLDGIEQGATPSGRPEITFQYTLNKAPGSTKLEFYPKDKDYYYVVKNGQYSNIIVRKAQFDKPEGVRDTYKKLVEILNQK